MKTFKQYLNTELLYHGTSLTQYQKIVANDFNVKNLYIGDNRENITNHYAEEQSMKDGSYPVTIIFDGKKIKSLLNKDYHDDIEQIGQYYFSGNCKKAIISVEMWNYDLDKMIKLKI